MTPENVIEPFRKAFHLPDSVVELLDLLLQYEIATGFRSLCWSPQYGDSFDRDTRHPALRYAKGLNYIFARLPQLADKNKGKFVLPIRQLAGISIPAPGTPGDEHTAFFHRLSTDTAFWEKRRNQVIYQEQIDDYKRSLDEDTSATGTDRARWREKIRDLEKEMKDLDRLFEWDMMPRMSQFWQTILDFNVSIDIPQQLRFRHTHVLAAPDAGKTVMLEFLANQDIQTDACVIVIAPKSTLIPNLIRRVDPERLVLFSPEHQLALNIFDLGARQKDETAINQTVELMEYVFESLLDAGTTWTQQAPLRWCIRLMLCMPDATLSTLFRLLNEQKFPAEYDKYLPQLPEAGQIYFREKFSTKTKDSSFDTKGQLYRRLDNLFSGTPAIQRMFSESATEVDMSRFMAEGKVILVDTSLEKNGKTGSSFIGRFFLGLVALAARQRGTSRTLRPVYCYVDELSLYVSDYLNTVLDLARENRVGLTLAHQGLDQLGKIEPAVHRTGIKFVGMCNDDDAAKMARMFPGVQAGDIQQTPARSFWFFAKDFLPPMRVQANKEYLDSLPTYSEPRPRVSQDVPRRTIPSPTKKESTDDPGTGRWKDE